MAKKTLPYASAYAGMDSRMIAIRLMAMTPTTMELITTEAGSVRS
jgi:hypothetical protein